MPAWTVVPCLLKLRDEFNRLSPGRDKGADGTIGDSNHTSTSDHTPDEDSTALRGKDADSSNEVHALDIDSSGPWPDGKRGDIEGSWFDKEIKKLIAEEKRRWLDPNDMCRLNYIIWRGHIYDKDDNDFAPRAYTGADPHTNHAHFSARYETRAENDTRPWGIWEDDDMALSSAELDDIAERVWARKLRNPYSNTDQAAGDILRYAPSRQGHLDTQTAIAALSAQLAQFVTAEATDDAARAAAQTQMREALDGLAASVVAQVIAALPEGSDPVSQEEVTTAVSAAFRSAFAA